jgi:hypothetical protein
MLTTFVAPPWLKALYRAPTTGTKRAAVAATGEAPTE